MRLDTWNLSGTQGNVFGNPQTPYQGIFDSLDQSATGGNSVQKSTGKPVARSEEQNRDTIPNFEICKETVDHEFFLSARRTTEFYSCSANTANLGPSFR